MACDPILLPQSLILASFYALSHDLIRSIKGQNNDNKTSHIAWFRTKQKKIGFFVTNLPQHSRKISGSGGIRKINAPKKTRRRKLGQILSYIFCCSTFMTRVPNEAKLANPWFFFSSFPFVFPLPFSVFKRKKTSVGMRHGYVKKIFFQRLKAQKHTKREEKKLCDCW